MMLLVPVLMCIYTSVDISDIWYTVDFGGSHLLTLVVKAIAFNAGFSSSSQKFTLRQEISKQLPSKLSLLIKWSALY